METETKVMSLLTNEPSELIKVDERTSVRFKRPSLPEKHRGRAWGFKKMKEYGYDPSEENAGTMMLDYWAHINSFVTEIVRDGKPFKMAQQDDYTYLFEKFLIEEIYDAGEREEPFLALVMAQLALWMSAGEVSEEELKNS